MRFRSKIAVAIGILFAVGCQELPNYFVSDTTLARVGRTELQLHEVSTAVPEGMKGEDSAAFVKVYVDRWVKQQLKLNEAEELFSSSEADIDKRVEEYRQALLIRKLEQYYVDRNIDTTFTDTDIAAYYNTHKEDFKLDATWVKGRIIRFNENFRQARKLRDLMASPLEAQQRTFRDMCEKNNFKVNDFADSWVDYQEFLSFLPTLRSENYDPLLASSAVQQMRDYDSYYYFQITAVRRAGETIPLEHLRPTIRRILFNQRQSEVIRNYEEQAMARALEEEEVRIYDDNN